MIGRLSLRGSASLVGSTHPISSSSRIGVGPPPSGTSSRSTLMCSPYTVSRTRLYPRMCCPVPPLRRETASDQYTNWAVVFFALYWVSASAVPLHGRMGGYGSLIGLRRA